MSPLLFSDDQHAHAAALTTRFAAEYLGSVAERPVFPPIDRDALRAILQEPLPEEARSIEALFAELDEVIVPNSTHTAHPRFLPYVQPSPSGLSPFADAVAGTLNQNCNLWQLSPAANAVEQVTVRWLAELSGFGAPTAGLLTSGGSVANLVGLAAARDWALGDDAREHGLQRAGAPLVLYASDQTHSSVDKAARILGLGGANVRQVPSDDAFRLRADALAKAIAEDRALGLRPFAVVASAGSVTTGAFDPLDEIADVCARESLWLHVDGAYGALAGMSAKFRPALAGIARANSVSLDPHKLLFTSFDAGCVLVRDPQALRRTFAVTSSYLAQPADAELIDYADHGPQLSRAFRALKVWWSLRHYGRRAHAETVERMAYLAEYMGTVAREHDAFEILAPVTFNCVCFRLAGIDDAGNRAALASLVESGLAFLGPASVKGRLGLRACFMNLRTTELDVDATMNALAEWRTRHLHQTGNSR